MQLLLLLLLPLVPALLLDGVLLLGVGSLLLDAGHSLWPFIICTSKETCKAEKSKKKLWNSSHSDVIAPFLNYF